MIEISLTIMLVEIIQWYGDYIEETHSGQTIA